jgi:hypothetical protein
MAQERPTFIPGLELSRAFYDEVVRPLLGDRQHASARIGEGSDVLGFDTERSTDHGWGPRLEVFVEEADVGAVRSLIDRELPATFRGWPTRFGWDEVAVSHHVSVATLDDWLEANLGFGAADGIGSIDWLSTPQQLLLQVTGGAVFHDGLGRLEPAREALGWYPDDVWLWLLACQWRRLDQEEPFVGRTAEVGDDLGSRLIAARLVRDLMRLCFLIERRYAPYSKWLGTAFGRLDASAEVGPELGRALDADAYPAREGALADACEAVARRHNALGLTDPVDPTVRPFFDRPFLVLGAGRFVDACVARIQDPWLKSLPLIGSIDQFTDSTDVLTPAAIARVRRTYE